MVCVGAVLAGQGSVAPVAPGTSVGDGAGDGGPGKAGDREGDDDEREEDSKVAVGISVRSVHGASATHGREDECGRTNSCWKQNVRSSTRQIGSEHWAKAPMVSAEVGDAGVCLVACGGGDACIYSWVGSGRCGRCCRSGDEESRRRVESTARNDDAIGCLCVRVDDGS